MTAAAMFDPPDPLDERDVEPGGQREALRQIAANLRSVADNLAMLARNARLASDEFNALVASLGEDEP